jgi:hypothetical protein
MKQVKTNYREMHREFDTVRDKYRKSGEGCPFYISNPCI